MKLKLRQRHKVATLGCWVRVSRTIYQCGNVRVIFGPYPGRNCENWRIEVRNGRGEWIHRQPAQRTWGYGHPGQAKIGAALMAAHERGVFR